jgi:hypothetical protein
VNVACRVLDVAESSFYAARQRGPDARAEPALRSNQPTARRDWLIWGNDCAIPDFPAHGQAFVEGRDEDLLALIAEVDRDRVPPNRHRTRRRRVDGPPQRLVGDHRAQPHRGGDRRRTRLARRARRTTSRAPGRSLT